MSSESIGSPSASAVGSVGTSGGGVAAANGFLVSGVSGPRRGVAETGFRSNPRRPLHRSRRTTLFYEDAAHRNCGRDRPSGYTTVSRSGIMRVTTLAALAVLAVGSPSPAQDAKPKDTEAANRTRTKLLKSRMTVEFKNVPLRDVLKELAAQTDA